MTLEQIASMAAAAKKLRKGGALSVNLPAPGATRVHIRAKDLAAVVAELGQAVPVAKFGHTRYWEASITRADVSFFALYEAEELPLIGYHLVDGHPVLITEGEGC